MFANFGYRLDSLGNRTGCLEANGDVVSWSYDNAYQFTNERRTGANA